MKKSAFDAVNKMIFIFIGLLFFLKGILRTFTSDASDLGETFHPAAKITEK